MTSGYRVSSVLAFVVFAAACSLTDNAPSTHAPTTAMVPSSTTTTTTTVGPFVAPPFTSAFPDVEVNRREIGRGEEAFAAPPLAQVAALTPPSIVPIVVFTDALHFSPSVIDLEKAVPVRFANESDGEIVVHFDPDAIAAVTIAPGETVVVDLRTAPDEIIRYETTIGLVRPVGSIDVRGVGGPVVDSATDWTGALRLDLPDVREWQQSRGYRSIAIAPDTTAIDQGPVSAAILFDVTPFDPGLRVDASSHDDAATAARRLTAATPPGACDVAESVEPSNTSMFGEALRFRCGYFTLEIGYLVHEDGAVYYSFADIDGEFELGEALATLQVGAPGTYLGPDGESDFLVSLLTNDWVAVDELELDIVNGTFGAPFIVRQFTILSPEVVHIRNFDDARRQVRANGEPLVELEPGEAASFSVTDFDLANVVLSVGEHPWARLDVTLDTALREPLEALEMRAYPGEVVLEAAALETEVFLGSGIATLEELVPADWEQVTEVDDLAVFERMGGELDVAAYSRRLVGGVDFHLGNLAVEQRLRPTKLIWLSDDVLMARFEVPGRPWITVIYTGFTESPHGEVAWALELISAPEEHDALVETLLRPAVTGFEAEVTFR